MVKRRAAEYKVELTPTPEHVPWYKCFKRCFLSCVDRFYWTLHQPLSLTIHVIGPADAGKTSIIRRYAGDIFYEEKFEAPKGSVFQITSLIKVRRKTRRFNVRICESSSSKTFERLLNKTGSSKSTGLLFIYTSGDQEHENYLRTVIERLKSESCDHNDGSDSNRCRHGNKSHKKRRLPAFMIAGNKSDTVETDQLLIQNSELKCQLEDMGISHVSISAKDDSDDAIPEMVNALIKRTAMNKTKMFHSKSSHHCSSCHKQGLAVSVNNKSKSSNSERRQNLHNQSTHISSSLLANEANGDEDDGGSHSLATVKL